MDPEMAAIFKKSTAVSSKYELFKNIFNVSFNYSLQGFIRQSAPEWQQAKKN